MFEPVGYEICSVEESLEKLKGMEILGVDTETRGFDPYTNELLSVQIGNREYQYVIDVSSVNPRRYKELLESKLLLMHNAKFDLRFLYHYRIVPTKIYDTFLGEKILTNGDKTVQRSLDACVYRYCKITLDKSVRGVIHREGLSTRVIRYAADDVKYLEDIMVRQLDKAEKLDLKKAISLDNKYVNVLAYIEYSGFYLDKSMWEEKCKEDDVALKNAEYELDDWLLTHMEGSKFVNTTPQLNMFEEITKPEVTINWSSSKQVIELFKMLGMDVQTKDKATGKMKDSVESSVIDKYKDEYPIVKLFIEYQKRAKEVSTYGRNFYDYINPTTGRIHTVYNQLMETGRLSSGQAGKPKKGIPKYPNLQNIPREKRTRECFTSETGHTLVVCDYSGQEQIVLANKSMDKDILSFYQKGLGDMHSFVASKIYPELANIGLKEIKENHKGKRQVAKAAGFAINYGGVGATIATNLGISIEEGDKVYDAYFEAFPGLKNYFKKIQKEAIDKGYVEFNSVSGRKWFAPNFHEWNELGKEFKQDGFWDRYRKEKAENSIDFQNVLGPKVRRYFKTKGMIERIALNYPIQGTSADITKLAGIYIFRELVKKQLLFKVWMPNVVHDEILLECPIEMSKQMATLVQECMERAGEKFCKTIKLKAEPVITKEWEH
jgi:DNA polymerase-1